MKLEKEQEVAAVADIKRDTKKALCALTNARERLVGLVTSREDAMGLYASGQTNYVPISDKLAQCVSSLKSTGVSNLDRIHLPNSNCDVTIEEFVDLHRDKMNLCKVRVNPYMPYRGLWGQHFAQSLGVDVTGMCFSQFYRQLSPMVLPDVRFLDRLDHSPFWSVEMANKMWVS